MAANANSSSSCISSYCDLGAGFATFSLDLLGANPGNPEAELLWICCCFFPHGLFGGGILFSRLSLYVVVRVTQDGGGERSEEIRSRRPQILTRWGCSLCDSGEVIYGEVGGSEDILLDW